MAVTKPDDDEEKRKTMNRITALEVGEISLVGKPATGKKFLITKADADDDEHKGEGPVVTACRRLTKALEDAQQQVQQDQEFLELTGTSFAEWDEMDEVQKQQARDNAHARTQIERLESLLDELAAKIKRKGETHEQAYVRAMRSEEGEKICRELNTALAVRR